MSHDPARTTNEINREKVDGEFVRNKLKLKSLEAKESLFGKYPHVQKFFADKGLNLSKIREHSAKIITAGALTGTLLFTPPLLTIKVPALANIVKNLTDFKENPSNISPQVTILSSLQQILPQKVGPLDRSQEKTLEQVFRQNLGVSAKATLEGEHLNSTYGYIGAEQHLARYPGDSVPDMAPGLGAWGYVPAENEKWYAVVQTLYLPDWNTRQPFLQNWYKYRKVLIVNTTNGNAIVADIADAGPAAWTGKQFGGSPEVMDYLGGPSYKKGPVIVFFVDDPNNQVQLGPVDYNKVNASGLTLVQT
jgi:hypothetical protein